MSDGTYEALEAAAPSVRRVSTSNRAFRTVVQVVDTASLAEALVLLCRAHEDARSQKYQLQVGELTVGTTLPLVPAASPIIALLTAGFGIVNALLITAEERIREIGLMKTIGLGGGKVFTMFGLEAVFIGLLEVSSGRGSQSWQAR